MPITEHASTISGDGKVDFSMKMMMTAASPSTINTDDVEDHWGLIQKGGTTQKYSKGDVILREGTYHDFMKCIT